MPTLRIPLAWHKLKRIGIHGLPTLPRDGELAEYFPQNHGARVFAEQLAATHPPRKNPVLPHEKLRAFSLPQDVSVQLMFGAARFGEPVLSVSRSLGFYILPRRGDSPHRLDTPLKRFNQRLSLDATRSFAAPCGVNACSGVVFCKLRRA